MISQANSSSITSAYASSLGDTKTSKASASTTVSKQGDTSKIEQIKESIASGDYKIDLEALSRKIADELMY